MKMTSTNNADFSGLYYHIWKGAYPSKVKCFIWELSPLCINTLRPLTKETALALSLPRVLSFFCHKEVESQIYIIGNCLFPAAFWNNMLEVFTWYTALSGDSLSFLSLFFFFLVRNCTFIEQGHTKKK